MEKRKTKRVPTGQLGANINRGGVLLSVAIYDISTGGFGVFSEKQLSPGDTITIEIAQNNTPLSFKCKVVWVQPVPAKGRIIKERHDWNFQNGLEVIFQNEQEKEILAQLHLQMYN